MTWSVHRVVRHCAIIARPEVIPMSILLAILISGTLLSDAKDIPMSRCHFSFLSPDGKRIEAITDKDGKFSVDIAPGTYRLHDIALSLALERNISN